MSVPWKHALRDAVILAGTLALWRLEAASPASVAVALAAGVAAALCGYLAHEWGHLAGAWLAGGVVHLPGSVGSTFLFRFDSAYDVGVVTFLEGAFERGEIDGPIVSRNVAHVVAH